MRNLSKVSFGIIFFLVVITLSTFTVDQREHAIVFRLGEIVSVKEDPGLYLKAPLIDNVRFFEKRIMTYDPPQPDRFITSEKKNVLVDSYIKWRIIDPSQYYVSVNGDERQAERRLSQTVNDGLRAEFGKKLGDKIVFSMRSDNEVTFSGDLADNTQRTVASSDANFFLLSGDIEPIFLNSFEIFPVLPNSSDLI